MKESSDFTPFAHLLPVVAALTASYGHVFQILRSRCQSSLLKTSLSELERF